MYFPYEFFPYRTVSNFQWNDDQPSCSNATPPQCESLEILEDYLEAPLNLNESQSSADTPATKKNVKRRRMEEESHERFDRICGSIEAVISKKVDASKNSAFLQMLDECLQKKPEDVQERLKIELLTYAFNSN